MKWEPYKERVSFNTIAVFLLLGYVLGVANTLMVVGGSDLIHILPQKPAPVDCFCNSLDPLDDFA